MTLEQIASVLHLYMAVVILGVFVFWLWRGYRVDRLRQQLFALRDELFDYAAAGAVAFEHPAYTRLRRTLNGVIRFSHRATFLQLILALAANGLVPVLSGGRDSFKEWDEAVASLPSAEVQRKLRELHFRLTLLVGWHVVTGSVTLMLGVIVLTIAAAVTGAAKRVQRMAEAATELPHFLEAQARALSV